jgi:putative sterol carrier protein
VARFLTQEWLDELVSALNSSLDASLRDVRITLQQIVIDAPDGQVALWTTFDNGAVTAGLGQATDADVTITEDYETGAALARGDLNFQGAFMQGKLKITGNMGKLLQNQAALQALQVMESLETEY